MGYMLRSLQRKLSLVIATVDVFTGFPARGLEVVLKNSPNKALVKPEGWHVFYDLPEGEQIVCLRGEGYFSESVTVMVGHTAPVVVKMIPNRGYPVSAGVTWVEGSIAPNTTVYVIPRGYCSFKLLRHEEDKLIVLSSSPYNLAGGYITIGVPQEFCWVEERLDDHTYRAAQPLSGQYPRNEQLFPVSMGRSDAGGDLFCPIRRFLQEHHEIWLHIDGELMVRPAAYGKANGIKEV